MLNTEKRNPNTTHMDKMTSMQMVEAMQNENYNAVKAIDSELNAIAMAIDIISENVKKGGRLFYIGCGTSGRLGVLDAAECPPTFGVSKDVVVGIIAGGDGALKNAVEGAEDSYEKGAEDISEYNLNQNDSVIGISVAGGAQYVIGAMDAASKAGALTVAITSNRGSKIDEMADIKIHPDTGAEVVAGSTRLKAGTAHKMILNMISTCVMVKQGHVYQNMMINLKPANIKLRDRMIRIVCEITGCDYQTSEKLLDENEWTIRKAVDTAFKNSAQSAE